MQALRLPLLLLCLILSINMLIQHFSSGKETSFLNIFDFSNTNPNYLYPTQTNWKVPPASPSNVSHFIYRDMNQSGQYDKGDKPLVNIAVQLTRPDGSPVIRRSNIHGFVNFTNRADDQRFDVYAEGQYLSEVLPPDGWKISSANQTQTNQYRFDSKTRHGIIADKVPEPIGLVQNLSVTGQFLPDQTGPFPVKGVAENIAGARQQFCLQKDYLFSVDLSGGEWLISLYDSNDKVVTERQVTLQHAPVIMSLLSEADVENKQSSLLIDFEDITQSVITKMPNHTSGLQFSDLIVTDNEYYDGPGYVNNTISGRYVGYNTSGYPVTISHPEGFDFIGAYFGVAWPQAEGEELIITAYRDEQIIAEHTIILSYLGPVWFDANYRDITKLELKTKHYWQFVTDDMQFAVR